MAKAIARRRRAASALERPNDLKPRAVEGQGGTDGVVLALTMRGDGVVEAFYTVDDVFIGSDRKQVSMLVDTGSSDMWVASTSCKDSECNSVTLYDPSQSGRPTGKTFDIPYIQGHVTGPVFWDHFELGGYILSNQAFCAAEQISSEPLSRGFSGLIGLALQPNSIIAQELPPGLTDTPDGAPLANNIFSTNNSPAHHFFSVSLSRPGSDRVPSLLGIGRHPSALVPDPSKIKTIPLEPSPNGFAFWRVRAGISIWGNGNQIQLDVGRNWPIAILDTGGANILASPQICGAVYGHYGIDPDEHGQYFVPCDLAMNITITLDRYSFPIHPLDMSFRSSRVGDTFCIGALQPSTALNGRADMILGVAFLRNVYMVLNHTSPASVNPNDQGIIPSLGLMSLTDMAVAAEEWSRVREHGGSLSGPNTSPGDLPLASSGPSPSEIGRIAAISVGAFVGGCLILFVAAWLIMRRRFGNGRRGGFAPSPVGVLPPTSILNPRPSLKTEYAPGMFGRVLGGKYAAAPTQEEDVEYKDPWGEECARVMRYNRLAEAAGLMAYPSVASEMSEHTKVGTDEFGVGKGKKVRWKGSESGHVDYGDEEGTTLGTRYHSQAGSAGRGSYSRVSMDDNRDTGHAPFVPVFMRTPNVRATPPSSSNHHSSTALRSKSSASSLTPSLLPQIAPPASRPTGPRQMTSSSSSSSGHDHESSVGHSPEGHAQVRPSPSRTVLMRLQTDGTALPRSASAYVEHFHVEADAGVRESVASPISGNGSDGH